MHVYFYPSVFYTYMYTCTCTAHRHHQAPLDPCLYCQSLVYQYYCVVLMRDNTNSYVTIIFLSSSIEVVCDVTATNR